MPKYLLHLSLLKKLRRKAERRVPIRRMAARRKWSSAWASFSSLLVASLGGRRRRRAVLLQDACRLQDLYGALELDILLGLRNVAASDLDPSPS